MSAAVELPLPTFLVIGAQKAGTHWVRDNLRAHPDVFMPVGEVDVFTRPEEALAAGPDAYRRAFGGWAGEPVVGEATPAYLMWRLRPAAMARAMDELVPDLRLVALLRNPVDRAFSAFAHFRRRGQIPTDVVDLATAVRDAGPPEHDALGLVSGGWYAASLRPYIEVFGDRLLVQLHDDLVADPATVYRTITGHIGAAADFVPADVDRARFAFDHTDYGVAPIDAAARRELFSAFADDVAELEVLIDRDLSGWRPGSAPLSPPAAPATRRSGAGIRLLDLGCGDGSSLIDAQNRFGFEGVGLEIDSGSVARACARGLDVGQADIRGLEPADYPDVEVVYLDNVLEHLASLDDIDTVLRFACRAASRLVYIRHPSFEDVDHLAALGLKLHWTDWPTSHTAPARLHELVRIVNRHGCYDVDIRPQGPIRGSSNPLVLPISAPPNQFRPDPAVPSVYREDLHGPKPELAFDRPVFQMFEIEIHTGGSSGRATAGRDLGAATGPGDADPSWLGQLRETVGCEPIVAERTGGGTVVVEGGLVRPVSGTIIARALRIRFGCATLSDDDLAGLRPGPPVVLLKAPGESAFVVVGGRRVPVPAVGVSVQAGEEWFVAFEPDQPLDPLRAAAELQEERRLRSR